MAITLRRMRLSSMGKIRNAYISLVRKPERKRPSGRSEYNWKDNITVDLTKMKYNDMA
jgi:hypothetical protein